MTWDPDLGVYVVVGMPGVYYLEPYYYRRDGSYWLYSRSLQDWHQAPAHGLPPGLAKRYAKKTSKDARGKRRHNHYND